MERPIVAIELLKCASKGSAFIAMTEEQAGKLLKYVYNLESAVEIFKAERDQWKETAELKSHESAMYRKVLSWGKSETPVNVTFEESTEEFRRLLDIAEKATRFMADFDKYEVELKFPRWISPYTRGAILEEFGHLKAALEEGR